MASLLDSVAGMVRKQGADPRMLDSLKGLLGNDSPIGGLPGLLGKAKREGLGDKADSWVSTGKNQPVSASQIEKLLGNDQVASIAAKLGISPDTAAKQISAVLPKLVDQLTPNGKVPDK